LPVDFIFPVLKMKAIQSLLLKGRNVKIKQFLFEITMF